MKNDEKLDAILAKLETVAQDVTAVKADTEETAVLAEAIAVKVDADLPPAPGPDAPTEPGEPQPV